MIENSADFVLKTYLNPVYLHSFPDPFILKFRGEYFAYCTGLRADGTVFTVLNSRDLVNWTEIGGALEKLENDAPHYWAPEVIYSNGKFYLYYSVGNETYMELRVAVSDAPGGGFVDAGVKLTDEEFAIDAHVFTDDDNKRYLFYATDFLTHSHIGTGIVVDKMIDFFKLEGNPRPVTRAKYDWQIYDANRIEKGGVRWHTVEGAFVLKRKNKYFLMFSGGNWQNISYGVSFAVTDSIESQKEWTQFSDGEKVFPILRTIPEKVLGPGHNSVVRGLNNREFYCIYHRWTENGRVLAIDRMNFAGNRIFVEGASFTPQIAPFPPNIIDFFDDENFKRQTKGKWNFSANEAVCEFSERSEIIYQSNTKSFLCEFSLRLVESIDEKSSFGFSLKSKNETILDFSIFPALNQAIVRFGKERFFQIPEDFNFSEIHFLRVEVDEFRIKFSLDDTVLLFDEMLAKKSTQISLAAKNSKAGFSGFAVSEGFEDLFDWTDTEIERRGWEKSSDKSVWRVENQELIFENKSETETFLTKGAAHKNFEFAVNIRLLESFGAEADFGFVVLDAQDKIIQKFSLTNVENYSAEDLRQFRFLKSGEKLIFQLEETSLREITAPEICRIGVFTKHSRIALETVRLTVL